MKFIKKVLGTTLVTSIFFSSLSFSTYKLAENNSSNSINRIFLSEAEGFDSQEYLKENQVIPSSYTSSDNSSSLSYAFDNDYSTVWQSLDQAKTEVIATFSSQEIISKIIYKATATNGGGEGYPKNLSIYYSSTSSSEYSLVGTIVEESTAMIASGTDEKVIFSFSTPVNAKSIKLVFDNCQYDSRPRASEIRFLKNDTIVEKVENLFTDTEKTILSSNVNSTYLSNLKTEIANHILYQYLNTIVEKAEKVLQGQITDFPVYTIQKTGNDNERNIIFIVGDGYSSSQQDDFINDCKKSVEKLFTYEPYAHYRNFFNIYAMEVESNDGKYFETYITGRVSGMTSAGWKKLAVLKTQMEKYYLDSGASLTNGRSGVHTAVLVNSEEYGGARYPEASIIYVKTSNGYDTFVHELSHGFGKLMDEYSGDGGHTECANNSKYSTKEEVPWKDYWGFRADKWGYNTIGAISFTASGITWYKPSNNCMMKDQGTAFCSVCEGQIASIINETIGDENMPMYAFRPWIRAIKDNNYVGTLYDYNGVAQTSTFSGAVKLEISTLVTNYTDFNQTVTLVFDGFDNSGEKVVSIEANKFTIEPNQTKNISITTSEINLDTINLSNFSSKVINLSDNSILSTDKTGYLGDYDDYGLVKVSYIECDENKSYVSELKNYSSFEIPVIVGNKYEISQLKISGYKSMGSNIDSNYVSPTSSTNIIEVKYYYYPSEEKECTHENGYDEKDINIEISPTCSKDGKGTVVCSLCNETITVTIPKTNIHNYTILVSEGKEATCLEKGKESTYKCETCDLTKGGEEIEAHNHSFTKTLVLPTNMSYGYTIYTCEICSYSYRSNYKEPIEG